MRTVNVLCVCGSGTATSAMLSAKIRDVLEEHGYDCDTDETNPPGVATMMLARPWDVLAYTSPVEEDCGIPHAERNGIPRWHQRGRVYRAAYGCSGRA